MSQAARLRALLAEDKCHIMPCCFDALSAKLIAQGLDPARAGQLKSPAGLDIHAIDPHEIALSILAEIVLWRNTDKTREASDDEKRA